MGNAVAKKIPTPKPKPIKVACSICEEDWAEHPDDPTVLDCIEILKSKRQPKVDACCGHHYHNCCHGHHFWHYWYGNSTYSGTITVAPPIQVTPTSPTWTINTPLAGNTAHTPSLSNTLHLVS